MSSRKLHLTCELYQEFKEFGLFRIPNSAKFSKNHLPKSLRSKKKVKKESKYLNHIFLTREVMKFAHKGYKGFIEAMQHLILEGWGLDAFIIGMRGTGKSNVLIKISEDLSIALNTPYSFRKNLFVADSIIYDVYWLKKRGFGENQIVSVDEGGKGGLGRSSGLSALKKASRSFFMVKRDFEMPFICCCPDESDLDTSIVDKDMMFRIITVRRNHKEKWVEIDVEWNSKLKDLRGLDWISFAKGIRIDYIEIEKYKKYLKEKQRKLATAESWETMQEEYNMDKKKEKYKLHRTKRIETLKKIKDIRDKSLIDNLEDSVKNCLTLMFNYNLYHVKLKEFEITKSTIYNHFRKKHGKEKCGIRWFNIAFDDWELENLDNTIDESVCVSET